METKVEPNVSYKEICRQDGLCFYKIRPNLTLSSVRENSNSTESNKVESVSTNTTLNNPTNIKVKDELPPITSLINIRSKEHPTNDVESSQTEQKSNENDSRISEVRLRTRHDGSFRNGLGSKGGSKIANMSDISFTTDESSENEIKGNENTEKENNNQEKRVSQHSRPNRNAPRSKGG